MTTLSETATFLDALVDAIERAAIYNRNDQCAPVAILWTDETRQWEPLLPALRERLPLLALGDYSPETRTGPAYWLRCVVDHALTVPEVPADATPVIYLPGVGRPQMRAVEDCPKELQPLAGLQYRGVFWSHKNGRDWTIAAFLQNANGGLHVEITTDAATRQAMQRALVRLVAEPVERLRAAAPLKTEFFDALLNPDEVRSLLSWLNDPEGYPKRCGKDEWASLVDVCKRKYGFDPEQDGEVTAAALLGKHTGPWKMVWQRFVEAPKEYPKIPELLRIARPQTSFLDVSESWPQDNEQAEAHLRQGLTDLHNKLQHEAINIVEKLEATHGERRSWVWAKLGWLPLATALEHLASLAQGVKRPITGGEVHELATSYAEQGWQTDAAVLRALASVENSADVAAVKTAIDALYRPWLEEATLKMQQAIGSDTVPLTYPESALPDIDDGTCILFTDALRYDVGQRLIEACSNSGLNYDVTWRLAALPSVTPTSKPAVTPIASQFTGKGVEGLTPVLAGTGTKVTIQVLRKTLEDAGYQVLQGEDTGDPKGRAWTEAGRIDSYGHEYGWHIARHVAGEVRAIQNRIDALLQAGWERVIVVTDHGWLMLPGGLPKADLPEHLTDVRKGRCARLKVGSDTQQQIVPWYWDSSARIAVAPGIHAYEAGKEYEHGGLSPQECVVPMITVTMPVVAGPKVTIESVTWRGLRCRVQLSGAAPGLRVDVRTRPADPASSVTSEAKEPGESNLASLVVPDDELIDSAAVVVVVNGFGKVLAQQSTIIGQ